MNNQRIRCVLAAAALSAGLHLAQASGDGPHWQSPARLHRTLKTAVPGILILDRDGVEFRSGKFSHRWPYVEIHTFALPVARELILTTYQNRHWHEPGEQRFKFTLDDPIPPDVASDLAGRVEKPVRNGVPDPSAPMLAEIPARHHTWSGGSNGTLRLRESGIDYVTPDGHDGRSWRWSDIQTIANPQPYQLRVTAYREIFEFELKRPLSRELFDRLWDYLYAGAKPGGRP